MALEEFRSRFGKGMMELIGAAVLVLTIQISVATVTPMASVAVGTVLIVLVYAGFPISGAHYNPAISLAVFLRGKISMNEMLVYWLFQVGGGILGALLGGVIGGSFAAISRGPDYYFIQAFLAELVFTALLCFVVLAVATNSKTEGNQYYGAAIGLTVMAGCMAVGPISGSAFNPAVVLGLGITKHFWKMIYVAWVVLANILGAVAGAACFYIVAPGEFEHLGEEAREIANNARSRVGEARSLLPGDHS